MTRSDRGGRRPIEQPTPSPGAHAARPRIAYLSHSSGEYDARTFRMARSAIDAGYDVTVYSRWHPGLAPVEQHDGYRLVRVPADWRLGVPGLRGRARREAEAGMADAARLHAAGHVDRRDAPDDGPEAEASPAGPPGEARLEPGAPRARPLPVRIARAPFRIARRTWRRVVRAPKRWWRVLLIFPLRPLGWSASLLERAEPADLWHGMWAGSLPGLVRLRRRHGGKTIYDSRDVYMLSRDFAALGSPLRPALAAIERRWARGVDRVLTVNDEYALMLSRQLGVPRPPVVMNCPEAWAPPSPPPDLIRVALGLPASVRIALYQGQLMSDRGIEQAMDAILEVPDAVLVLLGFGVWEARFRERVTVPPYAGRVFVLPAVPPAELLPWSASADVMVMPIQPTSDNHRFTTPQKLFEAIGSGVPVVASDLPGMARIVTESGVGVLCDPTAPPSIAAAIRAVLDVPEDERRRRRAHVLAVAHERYNWAAQLDTLFGVYRSLGVAPTAPTAPAVPAATPRSAS